MQHHASVGAIAEGYAICKEKITIPAFYLAYENIQKLPDSTKSAKTILAVMSRLQKGADSRWNPYWMNSSRKLKAIEEAINKLPVDSNLDNEVQDSQSTLYKALNMPRISRVTLFGKLAMNQTKSAIAVKESITKKA